MSASMGGGQTFLCMFKGGRGNKIITVSLRIWIEIASCIKVIVHMHTYNLNHRSHPHMCIYRNSLVICQIKSTNLAINILYTVN